MNVKFKILVIIILGAGIIYQAYVFFKPKNDDLPIIPEIPLTLLDNTKTTVAELGAQKSTIVFIIRSNCNFCQKEAMAIRDNIDQFTDTEIIFLSFENTDIIKRFKNKYLPEDRPYITFAQATQKEVVPFLEYGLVFPYMLWYNNDGSQKAQHRGLFPIARILEVINQS